MDSKKEQMSFITMAGSDSELNLVNTDALVRKTEEQQCQIERNNQFIAELKEMLRDAIEIAEKYKEQIDKSSSHPTSLKAREEEKSGKDNDEDGGDADLECKPSFLRSVLEENESLKKQLALLSSENEELAQECAFMSEGLRCKSNEVLVLNDYIRDLKEHFMRIEGSIYGSNRELDEQDSCSQEEVAIGKIIPSGVFEQMDGDSESTDFGVRDEEGIITNKDAFDEEGSVKVGEGSNEGRIPTGLAIEVNNEDKEVISFEKGVDSVSNIPEDVGIVEDSRADEGSNEASIEDKVAIDVRNEDKEKEEVVGYEKANDSMSNVAEDVGNVEGSVRDESALGQENFLQESLLQNKVNDMKALSTEGPFTDLERGAAEKTCEPGPAQDGEDIISSMNRQFMSFLEKSWKIFEDMDKSTDPAFNQGRANVEILKLKTENCDLQKQKCELKELVDVLNSEANSTQEELRDTKTLKEELGKERDILKLKCEELESEHKYIYTLCERLDKQQKTINGIFKDLEKNSLKTEEELLKIKSEKKVLDEEKEELQQKAKQVQDLENKLKKWSEICGKLYLFLRKDNVQMAKIKERCQSISKLAKRDGFRRRKLEKKLKIVKRHQIMRKRIAEARSRMYQVMDKKALDMQIEICRLQCEILQLRADKDEFEKRYNSELGLSVSLVQEVEGLRSKVKFFEEMLEGNGKKIQELMQEKEATNEELERARDIKKQNGRRVEELMKGKEIIGRGVKDKDQELLEMKRERDDFEKQLRACNEMLSNISEKLEIESCSRQSLELKLEEEKRSKILTQKQLKAAVSEVNEAKELLEGAAIKNEESEGMIEALERRIAEVNEKKKGKLGRWFSKKHSSKRDSESKKSKRDSDSQ